jgi:hypothetical protein
MVMVAAMIMTGIIDLMKSAKIGDPQPNHCRPDSDYSKESLVSIRSGNLHAKRPIAGRIPAGIASAFPW